MGVASGDARRFFVGDRQIQIFDVLAGRMLDRLMAAERLAGHSEVVADTPTATYLGDARRIVDWRSNEATGERFAVMARLQS